VEAGACVVTDACWGAGTAPGSATDSTETGFFATRDSSAGTFSFSRLRLFHSTRKAAASILRPKKPSQPNPPSRVVLCGGYWNRCTIVSSDSGGCPTTLPAISGACVPGRGCGTSSGSAEGVLSAGNRLLNWTLGNRLRTGLNGRRFRLCRDRHRAVAAYPFSRPIALVQAYPARGLWTSGCGCWRATATPVVRFSRQRAGRQAGPICQ